MSSLPIKNVQKYQRPPQLCPVSERLSMVIKGDVVAETTVGWRVSETRHAPGYYLSVAEFAPGFLHPVTRSGSFCEWKGHARYYDLRWRGETQ